MGRYGNIDGIATLTHNPIAKDNSKGTIGKIDKKRKELKTQKPNRE